MTGIPVNALYGFSFKKQICLQSIGWNMTARICNVNGYQKIKKILSKLLLKIEYFIAAITCDNKSRRSDGKMEQAFCNKPGKLFLVTILNQKS